MSGLRVFILTVAACLVATVAQAAQSLEYAILKEGEPIGKEVVVINDKPNGQNVDVFTQTNVKLLFLEFNYEHERREVWEDGELVAMEAKTNDDGSHHEYRLSRDGEALVLHAKEKETRYDGSALPLSLWSKAALNRPILLSVIDGEPFKTKTTELGENHYRIDGDITRELWFADDGYLQKAAFKRKGFLIEFLRK